MTTPKVKVFKEAEIMPILEKEAKSKNLQIFVFKGEELNAYYETKYENIAVVMLAKNRDNAIWNLKNLRKCYMMWPEVNEAQESIGQ